MAWPAGMPLVTITQDVHKLPDGLLPSTYAVHLQLSVPALVFDGVTTLIRRSITLTAEAGSGVISDQVPHLNHPDLSPTPVYYMVTEFADGQRVRDPWQLTPAADDVTIDLDARAPIAGDPGTPVAVGPRGASTLAGLDDVDTTGLEDGFTIIWDATSETWQVGAGGAGAAALAELTDVDLTDLADGDALVWDATAGTWVRVSLSSTYAPLPTGTPDGTKYLRDDNSWQAVPGGTASTGVTADDTPAAPAEGESATYFVTSSVSWPAGLEWSTDPDGGVAPTITGTALVSLFTYGGTTRAVLGATFPALPAEAVPPTAGTLGVVMGVTAADLTVTGATDETALAAAPYAFTMDGGSTWTAYQAGATYQYTSLTPSTSYTFQHRVIDLAGNVSTGVAVTDSTAADMTGPTAGTLAVVPTSTTATLTVSGASDDVALAAAPYAYSSDGGSTWTAYQAGDSYEFTGLTPSTSYDFRHKVKDAAGNETLGTAVTDTTDAAPSDTTPPTAGTLASSSITDTTFTLTVSGASDETALDAAPYSFSTDNGVTWTAYQASASLAVTGKTAETGYTCQHKVKDAAGNISTGTAITVTTEAAAVAGLTFLQAANTDTDASTYTFSGQNLGTASPNRVILISVGARLGGVANYTISSVTVGGIAATIDKQHWYQANASGIARVAVPTGATGDVVVTFSTVMGRCGIALWSYDSGTLSVSATAQDGTLIPGDSVSLSITGAAGGFVLATSSFLATAGGTPASCVWTGITERFDQAIEVTTGNLGHSGGDTTDSGALTITGAWTPVDNSARRHASCAVAYAVA